MMNKTSQADGKSGQAETVQLSTLLDMTSPAAVHEEVMCILHTIDSAFDRETVTRLFHFTVDLYKGRHPQYTACDTYYHDIRHATDTYLAMARLLHGAVIEEESLSGRQLILGLAGALLHDAGMIRHRDEKAASGAEYVKDHVRRSMDFVQRHADELGLYYSEVEDVRSMIHCTDLFADIEAVPFSSEKAALLGKMLGTADLLAQMADRTYLEKLLFLFHEFREADIGDSGDEVEFLHNTLDFYEICDKRFERVLDGTYRFMVPHFRMRWNININLYIESLNKQRDFLKNILADENCSPYEYLKRAGIVQEVRRKFGKAGLRSE